MYYVYTHNRFNQVLIFETYEAAEKWLKCATRLSDAEIEKEIKTPRTAYNGAGHCFISE